VPIDKNRWTNFPDFTFSEHSKATQGRCPQGECFGPKTEKNKSQPDETGFSTGKSAPGKRRKMSANADSRVSSAQFAENPDRIANIKRLRMEKSCECNTGVMKKKRNKECDVPVEILNALRSGEQWAFNEVYARYAPVLKDFITALIHNGEDAKELNHEIFLTLWANRERIVPERGIKGFLYMRAKNLAMNYFDHEKVKQKYVDFCNHNIDYDLSPDMHMIGKETQTIIEIFLQGLSQQKQTIFRLRHEECLSVEEISTRLGLSPSTVKNNLSMVTTAIRDLIAMYIVIFLQSRF
jgi:RNA polymerase sigma-70 factor (ECF subfamily)